MINTMTATEKSEELFYKFNKITSQEFRSDTFTSATFAKYCAIISVNEIISALQHYGIESNELQNMDREINWWLGVKNELNKM